MKIVVEFNFVKAFKNALCAVGVHCGFYQGHGRSWYERGQLEYCKHCGACREFDKETRNANQ